MLDKLFEVSNLSVDMHFVFPLVLCPLEFEFEFRTISWHQSVNKVDLYLIDVDNVRLVATCTFKCQITINCSIVSAAHLK
jgi:hypothetical protein